MSRTELLQSITNPEMHAVAWFVEQHMRSMNKKLNRLTKTVADVRSGQVRTESIEKEQLEYAKVGKQSGTLNFPVANTSSTVCRWTKEERRPHQGRQEEARPALGLGRGLRQRPVQ